MSGNKGLFDDEDDAEEDTFQVNKSYAAKYDEWRRGEELQKLKDRLGDDITLSSESDSSSDDDFVEPDNPEFDRDFLLTLGALHKKDEKDLQRDNFFTGDYRIKKEKEEEEKSMTIRDYQREIILNHGAELDDENDSAVQNPTREWTSQDQNPVVGFDDNDVSSDDDGDGLLSSGLFKVKESSQKSKEKKPSETTDDVIGYLKGENSTISNVKDKNLLNVLRDKWMDPNVSSDEKWLADFFLNKRYLEDEDEAIERAYNEVVIDEETLSEDEKTLEKLETFETKYRFRYEEPDPEFIKKYPRSIPDSVRAPDERRKVKREAVKERKKKEKELKRQELLKLKALKYKEIEAKIEKIKEASGNMDIDLGEKILDDDFDPATHDQAMSRMFGNEYYDIDDGNTEKPVFSDDEDVIKDYDDWLEKEGPDMAGGGADQGEEVSENAEGDASWEDEYENVQWGDDGNLIMDADYDPSEALQHEMINASKKKVRRKSKFAKAISRRKPVFNPIEKNFDSYFDEYYQLDFEDIIEGVPCRFKYRKVESNNFGLSTEEILTAQDRELNKWYSLKKLLKYDRSADEEHRDRMQYNHRASLPHVKPKILPSLFVESPEQLQITEQEKKRLKNLKKKLRRQQRQLGIAETGCDISLLPPVTSPVNNEVGDHISSLPPETMSPLNNVATNNESPKKKKKNSKAAAEEEKTSLIPTMTASPVNNEESPKKKKKKRSREEAEDDNSSKPPVTTSPVNNDATNNEESPKKKKRSREEAEENSDVTSEDTLNNKKRIQRSENIHNGTNNDRSTSGSIEGPKKKKKKKKKKKEGQEQMKSLPQKMGKRDKMKRVKTPRDIFAEGLSDARLAAYGKNPKKFRNKIRYGKREF